jgi:hypothetical protein
VDEGISIQKPFMGGEPGAGDKTTLEETSEPKGAFIYVLALT